MSSSLRRGWEIDEEIRRESSRQRAILAALTKIVEEADRNPFNPIGHVIEHVVPEARSLLAPTASTPSR
jgi:hypothetical protein